MKTGDSKIGYGLISMINHWLIGLAVFGLLIVGLTLTGMERGPEKAALAGMHKAGGVMILLFGLWRIGWRLKQGFPDPSPSHPAWQHRAAFLMHWFLMAAIVLMALSGMLWSLTAGRPISMFGLFEIPAFSPNEAAADFFQSFHRLFSKAFIAAIVLHVLAAIYHALTDFGKSGGRMFTLK